MIYFFVVLIILIIDQSTKWLVVKNIKGKSPVTIIKDSLKLRYTENTGIAFSMLKDKRLFLILLTTILMNVIIYYFVKYIIPMDGQVLLKASFAMIIGGGMGNIIDRLRLGYVIDFIEIKRFSFAIFNMADLVILIGSLIMAILIVFTDLKI